MNKVNLSLLLILIFAAVGFSFAPSALAYTRVRGHFNRNGSYIAPHYRTSPNSSKWDNWSTKGNYNPFTGKKGYVSPYKSLKRYR